MLDLETASTMNNACLLSIGAYRFNLSEPQTLDQIEDSQKYYRVIDLQSCLDVGLEVDGPTIYWWMSQIDSCRKSAMNRPVTIQLALMAFRDWLTVNQYLIWGNGATFDNVILRNAYEACKIPTPWHYTRDMCYQTFKNFFGKGIPFERIGTHHHALDDAISQGLHLQKIYASSQNKKNMK